jgi:Holliday junction resolvase RusA-like endonuclease
MTGTNKFIIVIPENPVPQPRARVTRWGTYDPIKDKKNWIKWQIKEQFHDKLDCPLEIEMIFYMPIPRSTTKKMLKTIKDKKAFHVKKPDIDNLIITYLNCMTGIVYVDDRQVYSIIAYKEYSLNPHSELVIKWLKIE